MTPLLDAVFGRGGLTARFQPVVDATAAPYRVCYVEGLVSGPKGTNLEAADVLFSYIRRKREVARMDRLCVATIISAARALPAGTRLGLNVDAQTLVTDRGFPRYLCEMAALGEFAPWQIVVEVVEQSCPSDSGAFRLAIEELRSRGVAIGLDDVGCAHSNYRMMLETRPDFFKIDRYFVDGVHSDPLRQAILRSIASLSRSFGAQVVAEGVEREADLAVVREVGIDLIQGFLVTPLMVEGAVQTRRMDSVEEHGYR
jgi:EAL domain-containing protein (putative c-di-GMP-specific phosphodiesterase class I)